jgi:hypothetical protein
METIDAFVAAIAPDGRVHTGCMANPNIIPTVVAVFILDNLRFEAIYHDAQDAWEIFGEERGDDWQHRNQEWAVSKPGEIFYKCAEQTVATFNNKLLAGPCPDFLQKRLSDALKRSIMDEINNDIINDLLIASELPAISIPKLEMHLEAL